VEAEIEVFHPKPEPFGEPEPSPVEEAGDEAVSGSHMREHLLYLLPREHHGELLPTAGTRHLAEVSQVHGEYRFIEKDEGVEGLVLRRGGYIPLGGEVGEESRDVLGTEATGMARSPVCVAMEEAVAFDPPAVGLLRAIAVVPEAAGGADEIEELRLRFRARRRARLRYGMEGDGRVGICGLVRHRTTERATQVGKPRRSCGGETAVFGKRRGLYL
jgi:hypothetical protein